MLTGEAPVAVSTRSGQLAKGKPPTQNGTRSSRQLVAVFLCGVFAFLGLYSTQPLLPLLSSVFHATEVHVGLTISAATIGVAVSAVLLAVFGEGLNRKRTIVISMGLLGVCTLLTATAPDLNILSVWRLLQGLLTPGIFLLTIAYITEEWSTLQVPRAMSVYIAGTIVGGFLGRSLGGMIAGHAGWRVMFLVLGAVVLLGAPVTQYLLSPSRRHTVAANGVSRLSPLLANLRSPRLLATFGIGFCMLFALVGVFSFITFYLAAAPFRLSTTELSWLFAVYLIGAASTLAAGAVMARMGLRRGMLAAIALCFVGIALTLVHSLVVIAVGLAVLSSGAFIAQTSANSFLRHASPLGGRVSAVGMYICIYYIGGTIGGELPGVVWKLAGWPGCVALIGVFLVLATVLTLVFWPALCLTESDPSLAPASLARQNPSSELDACFALTTSICHPPILK